MYVPMLKTQREEMSVLKNMNYCFSSKIVPLVEIINETYQTKYKIDPTTGTFVYVITTGKSGKPRRSKVKLNPTNEDIITLEFINSTLKGKRAFIDYFRYTTDVYGTKLNLANLHLSTNLSRNFELYKMKLLEVCKHPSMIPTVSIKKGFDEPISEIKELITILQANSPSIAVRISFDLLDNYSNFLSINLRLQDFLLFDIGENHIDATFLELEDLQEYEYIAKKVLLNSPRKRSTKNAEFEINGPTVLIDNKVKLDYPKYNFDGYGDYCGLRDKLPEDGRSNGTGTAVALLYKYNENSFQSYKNPDSSLGTDGYKDIITRILKDKDELNPDGDCPAFEKIKQISWGNWSTWHNINMTRTIHQIYKFY